jgi:hypothetical protein
VRLKTAHFLWAEYTRKEELCMKKCPKCKELNPDSCNICESCGTMLDLKATPSLYSSKSGNNGTVEIDFERKVSGQLKNIEVEMKTMNETTETIKKCVIFFVILTIISMVVTFISVNSILSNFRF